MECRDCPRFDTAIQRCRDQKVNPARWDQAVEVAKAYGIRAICTLNDHREHLVDLRSAPPRERP